MKVSGKKKTEPLKIVVPRAKSSTKRPSDAEIALAKPVKRTKIALGSLTAPAVMRVGAVMSGAKGLAARCEKGRCSHSRPPDTSGTHVSRGFISGVAGIVASQPTPESCFETGHRCFVAACYCCRHQWGFRFACCWYYLRRLTCFVLHNVLSLQCEMLNFGVAWFRRQGCWDVAQWRYHYIGYQWGCVWGIRVLCICGANAEDLDRAVKMGRNAQPAAILFMVL
jgi:hypothetical protein